MSRLPDRNSNASSAIDNSVLDMLHELKHRPVDTNTPQGRKRTKVRVSPGKSVSAADLRAPLHTGESSKVGHASRSKRRISVVRDSSSSSESSEEIDTEGDEEEKEIGNEDQLKLGAFVHVRLPTKCSHRHYVGKIILKDVDDGISVEFLRKNKLTPHTFVAAASEDISSVEESWIIQVFRTPKIDRRGGFIIPEIDGSLKWE